MTMRRSRAVAVPRLATIGLGALSALLVLLVLLVLLGSGQPAGAVVGSFTDVPESHPFHDDITWLAGEGIATGFPDNTFRPTNNVTRQALAAYFYRAAGAPDVMLPAIPTFADVPVGHPFFKEIEWLAGEEITTGFPDGFHPSATASRQAIAAYFYRFAGQPAFAVPAVATFPDVPTTHPFAQEIELSLIHI